jgi:hypothetical protein
LSTSKKLPAYIGMWLSSMMLIPFAFVFIRQARNDSKMFSKDFYLKFFSAFKRSSIFDYFDKPTKKDL